MDTDSPRQLSRFSVDLMKEISKITGYNYTLDMVHDNGYGIFGNGYGMIGEVNKTVS